jgi:hypothetical protein
MMRSRIRSDGACQLPVGLICHRPAGADNSSAQATALINDHVVFAETSSPSCDLGAFVNEPPRRLCF